MIVCSTHLVTIELCSNVRYYQAVLNPKPVQAQAFHVRQGTRDDLWSDLATLTEFVFLCIRRISS
jgi:hypothetical protein